jgi:hypothetical protein
MLSGAAFIVASCFWGKYPKTPCKGTDGAKKKQLS